MPWQGALPHGERRKSAAGEVPLSLQRLSRTITADALLQSAEQTERLGLALVAAVIGKRSQFANDPQIRLVSERNTRD
jgi:hypothetical protein